MSKSHFECLIQEIEPNIDKTRNSDDENNTDHSKTGNYSQIIQFIQSVGLTLFLAV